MKAAAYTAQDSRLFQTTAEPAPVDRRYGTLTSEVRPIDQDEVVGASAHGSSTHMATPQERFRGEEWRIWRTLPEKG